jgi:hypothetical protein
MLTYLYSFLQWLFNIPDLKKIGEGFSESIHVQLNRIEKKILIYFIIIMIYTTLGFCIVYGCLESGFKWKYFFQF